MVRSVRSGKHTSQIGILTRETLLLRAASAPARYFMQRERGKTG
jgi:hypothetical protein